MKHNLNDKIRITHIIEAISDLEMFLKDIDFETFEKNREKQSAVERKLEIIGEAANHISEEVLFHPTNSTPWRQITNTRNIIEHEYFRVDLEIIYKIATNSIIPLKTEIQVILNDLEK